MDYIQPFTLFIGDASIILNIASILLEGLDVDDHDLDFVTNGELTDLAQIFGIVDKMIEGRVVIQPFEVLLHQVNG
ncbi:hypothetical protein ES703_47287 [subsurface metagenome]